ncbi:hypothetical protein EV177_003183, partial [Coemansia sp. RSA 1804]
EAGYYEIKVKHDGQTKTYYSEGAVIGAERLFGRHTRCFAASEERPVCGGREHRPDRFIKDAWPEATEDADADYRDESRHLRKVTERLAKAKAKGSEDEIDLDGMYPRYDSGGRVRIRRLDAGGKCLAVEDTSKSILSNIIGNELDRRHTDKMAALRSAKDESADKNSYQSHVMECHNAIYKRCNILHRDMSTNNILFTGSGSSIKGMLIDFDHAICYDDVDSMRNFERSGTLPYMSITNLERGDISKCADQKRADLHTYLSFKGITNGFDMNIPYIKGLTKVVHELRKTLIDDPEEATQRGALPNDPESDRDDWELGWDDVFKQPAEVDPFKERAKVADVIAKKLLQVMRAARENAQELLVRDEQKAAASDMERRQAVV